MRNRIFEFSACSKSNGFNFKLDKYLRYDPKTQTFGILPVL